METIDWIIMGGSIAVGVLSLDFPSWKGRKGSDALKRCQFYVCR